jgi:DNA primase
MEQWIDFKAVKAAVKMEEILAHYGISLRQVNATALRGRCPLPTHGSSNSGNSFTVSVEKNVWSCMSASCVAARGGSKGGNALDFTALMEKSTVRDAAVKLASWFMTDIASRIRQEPKQPKPADGERQEPTTKPTEASGEQNKILPFVLKGVTYCDYLRGRGISEETAATFGVGLFSGRGSMSGKIVIPIHNERGELVAYAGRATDDADPKYKFPAGFHKNHVLYNLHRVQGDSVILVEGFFGCMKVSQAGRGAVAALMGSSLSNEQRKLLVDRFRIVTLVLDGDEAGRSAAAEITGQLVHDVHVRIVDLPDGMQPDKLSSEEIVAHLPT